MTRSADIYELKLAEVSVPAGATKITQSMVTDCRLNDDVCGITVSAVQHIPTASFLTQMTAAFGAWFEMVRNLLDDDAAGNLLNLIQTHTTDNGNPHEVTAVQVGARPDTWTPSAGDVGAVPTGRTVNGKALNSDISLSALDVKARPNTWTPTVEDIGAAAATHTHTAQQIVSLTGTDYSTSRVRGISAGTGDLAAGSSTLASGTIYLVYE